MRHGLLFDCDGVLVDTERANYFSYLAALKTALGESVCSTFTPQAYSQVWGKPWREWLPSLAFDAADKVHRLKVNHYADCLCRYATILPGLDAMAYWLSLGVPVAIVSNASASSIRSVVSWIAQQRNFTDIGHACSVTLSNVPIITPTGDIPPKPDPAIIWEACARLCVNSGILIDDDWAIGMMTAKQAHIHFIHYPLDSQDCGALNEQIERLLG